MDQVLLDLRCRYVRADGLCRAEPSRPDRCLIQSRQFRGAPMTKFYTLIACAVFAPVAFATLCLSCPNRRVSSPRQVSARKDARPGRSPSAAFVCLAPRPSAPLPLQCATGSGHDHNKRAAEASPGDRRRKTGHRRIVTRHGVRVVRFLSLRLARHLHLRALLSGVNETTAFIFALAALAIRN